MQLSEHSHESLCHFLAAFAVPKQKEGFVVGGNLFQPVAGDGAVVEESCQYFLHFFRFFEEDVFCEVLEERGEVFGLFNKEQE